MQWILLTALFVGCPDANVETPASDPVASQMTAEEATDHLKPALQTGTLIFSQGDCLAIRAYTLSPYTHVGAVVLRHGEPMIYDAQGGVGVRCLSLDRYMAIQGTARLCILQPNEDFSAERAEQFERHLNKELGRPYSVKQHVTGSRVAGVHCAEYMTEALMSCHMVNAKNPARVSPASLREGLLEGELYTADAVVQLELPKAPPAASWCSRWWQCTKDCSWFCCRKMRGWVFCQ